jgi:hypothetical protein
MRIARFVLDQATAGYQPHTPNGNGSGNGLHPPHAAAERSADAEDVATE